MLAVSKNTFKKKLLIFKSDLLKLKGKMHCLIIILILLLRNSILIMTILTKIHPDPILIRSFLFSIMIIKIIDLFLNLTLRINLITKILKIFKRTLCIF